MLRPLLRIGGFILRAFFRGILMLRRPRPIHARGRVLDGRISWLSGAAPSGIRWIDEPPDVPLPVTARLSRSVGLPPLLPDVIGLALRVDVGGRPADIELASTGLGLPSRFLLRPHRSPSRARLGTLFPYRSARGPVLLCARTVSPRDLPAGGSELEDALGRQVWHLRMYHATPIGRWHAFADVALRLSADQDDGYLRFDAGRNELPGAETYTWVRLLRQPSYLLVQDDEPARLARKNRRRRTSTMSSARDTIRA